MSALGAGSNVKVYVPSPFEEATGPPTGSHDHQGPVSLNEETDVSQTDTVIFKG